MLPIIFEKILNSLSLTANILEHLRILLSEAQNKSHENANITDTKQQREQSKELDKKTSIIK